MRTKGQASIGEAMPFSERQAAISPPSVCHKICPSLPCSSFGAGFSTRASRPMLSANTDVVMQTNVRGR